METIKSQPREILSVEEKTVRLNQSLNLQKQNIQKLTAKYLRFVVFLILVGVALGVIGLIKIETYSENYYGTLGNYLSGTVLVAWSLAGIILIYIAFLSQKQQMIFQQTETNNSKLDLMKQNEMLLIQKFESTFFQLLQMQSNIVNGIDIRKTENMNEVVSVGRECFRQYHAFMKNAMEKKGADISKITIQETEHYYTEMFHKYQNDIGHYFRNLYHIIKFIDTSDIKDKKRYTNLIRAQLSSYELAVLFYNCVFDYGKIKFKPLAEKYALLKNSNFELIFNNNHKKEYASSAFDETETGNTTQSTNH